MRSFLRGTAWLSGAQAGRLLLQGATFVLVARALGAHGFGAFAASLALVSVLWPFAAFGAGNLLVMHLARQPESFGQQWGAALATVPAAGVPLAALTVGLGALILPVPVACVALVALAELIFARLTELCGQAFQGLERPRAVALLSMIQPALRLVAAVMFTTGGGGVLGWSVAYLAASAVSAAIALAAVTVLVGRPRFSGAAFRGLAREGGWFALAQSSANIYTDIDKTLLARLGSLPAAGVYAVAYRATAMAFTPVAGMLQATYARFFRRGQTGIAGSRRFAVELLPAACAYGAAAGIGLFAIAPLLPRILGSDYAAAAGALRWLAPLPLIQALFYLGGDALTGAGHQRIRTGLQIGTAGINALLCLWLIPGYGLRGAAWATLLALGFLAAAMWTAVTVMTTRQERDQLAFTTERVAA